MARLHYLSCTILYYNYVHVCKMIDWWGCNHNNHHSGSIAACMCGDTCVASSPSHTLFFNVEWSGNEARDAVVREPVHQHYSTLES